MKTLQKENNTESNEDKESSSENKNDGKLPVQVQRFINSVKQNQEKFVDIPAEEKKAGSGEDKEDGAPVEEEKGIDSKTKGVKSVEAPV